MKSLHARLVLQGDPTLRLRAFVATTNALSAVAWHIPRKYRRIVSTPAAVFCVLVGPAILPRDEWQAVDTAVKLSVEDE